MSTMQCPHGCVGCTTCENSAAAKDLRALREVLQQARFVVDHFGPSMRVQSDRFVLRELADAAAKVPFCERPPAGWYCTRHVGHEGPCAAHPERPAAPLAGEGSVPK